MPHSKYYTANHQDIALQSIFIKYQETTPANLMLHAYQVAKRHQTMTHNHIELGIPERIEIYHRGSCMEIVRKWFDWQIPFLTAFAVVWNGFLFSWYTIAGKNGNFALMLFPLLHVAIGIWLVYYVLAGWFNRTHIFVTPDKIEVWHEPIPWVGNKLINAGSIRQLYTKEQVSRSRSGKIVKYEVHAITRGRRNVKLVDNLPSSEQGLFIEQEIEKYLNIPNLRVRGEFGIL